ncbi:virion-associated protein [Serratia phage Moabite]|uniref:Virion-associated protein n=1 Tax=Serratia phage Moabite TaxID=2587814 RepID=A0A4Y5TP83_9CAUD|nr:baseplate assembly protein [Serratia phage Moabite]QDB71178.1 virion-associated protein [Serratia phage Moabite]
MSDIASKFFGIVAENKPLTTNNIMVWPVEIAPWMQGAIRSNPQTLEIEGKDSRGNPVHVKTFTDTVIEAEWRGTDSSWTTAPDVQRGEVVELIRYADQNKYYWRERGDQINLRRGETKRLMVSGNLSANGEAPNPDTHYMLEISGHGKGITISTSQANGEVAKYHVNISGGNGLISIGDDQGQELYLNTREKRVRMVNSDGTLVEIKEKDLLMNAEEDIGIVAGGNIYISCNNFNLEAADSLKFNVANDAEFTATKISLNGLIALNGPIIQEKSSSGDFTAKMKGPLEVEKVVKAEDFETSTGGITLRYHGHKGVQTGSGESGTSVPKR